MFSAAADWRHCMWDARLARPQVTVDLSKGAAAEAFAFIRRHSRMIPGRPIVLDENVLPRLRTDLESCRVRVHCHERFVIIRPVAGLDLYERRVFAWTVANILGEPLAQTTGGDRIAAVYARPGNGRIADGARYHQTREGGASHTDNVGTPETWEYLVFSSIRRAAVGGETILLNGFSIHQALGETPDALDVLQKPFWWEYRGLGDQLFQAPIITYSASGEPHFRYLRRHLESTHLRAGEPLTAEQIWALDTLDAVLDQSRLQFRTMLQDGEILIAYDSQVLHARSAFADAAPDAPGDVAAALSGPYRFFDRVWAKRRLVS